MKINIRHLILALGIAFIVVAATGCKNTANGAGKDIEKMGEKIQEKTQ